MKAVQFTTNFEKHNCKNPASKLLIDNFYNHLLNYLVTVKHSNILDVGCGEGFSLQRIQDSGIIATMEGIDFDKKAIRIGKKLFPQFKLQQGTIYKLPYTDKSFDVVLCNEVLEHLEEPDKALEELKRVCKSHLILSVPNEPLHRMQRMMRGIAISQFGRHPEHINHWTAYGFLKLLQKHDLKILKKSYPFAWTLVLAQKTKRNTRHN